MKTHNGMRPQDIVVLIKALDMPKDGWQYRDIAMSLKLSVSEISESLQRSHVAGLVDESKRKVYRQNLMEFLEHGLHYVFPAVPGTIVTGTPTAHSHPLFKSQFRAEINYVWPDDLGTGRGVSIPPLYKSVPSAVRVDDRLYLLLAAIDVYRIGKTRELKLAREILQNDILK